MTVLLVLMLTVFVVLLETVLVLTVLVLAVLMKTVLVLAVLYFWLLTVVVAAVAAFVGGEMVVAGRRMAVVDLWGETGVDRRVGVGVEVGGGTPPAGVLKA